MKNLKEIKERLTQYNGAKLLYLDFGYIAWQCSTGENIEILFIETKEHDKGWGKQLLREMCLVIKPYHSVFVMRLASNEDAGYFYRSVGFEETLIKNLYRGDDTVIGVIPFKKLCQNLLIK